MLDDIRRRRCVQVLSFALALVSAAPALWAQDGLPDATRRMLSKAGLDAGLLAGLDKELAVPAAWIDGARKEGRLKVRLTMFERQFAGLVRVFNARYPFIEAQHTRAVGQSRGTGPLIAYKSGTVIADVIGAFNTLEREWRKAGGLVDLGDLPAVRNLPPEEVRPGGIGAGSRNQFWCMAYNTQKVKSADLPRTWNDFLDAPRWRNGKVGMVNRAHLWLANLSVIYGNDWLDGYMTRLFDQLRPQLRKENLGAVVSLASLGEFEIGFPTGDFMTRRLAEKGAPVSFHCPEPVPTNSPLIGILKGSANPNAAKLFVNWYLSKEGQIAGYVHARQVPVHKDLQRREFLPFPETILGKKRAPTDARVLRQYRKVLTDFRQRWARAGGPAAERGGGKKKRRGGAPPR